MGTVPHALIAAFGGDTVAAAEAFAGKYADEMNVTVLVDFENDSVKTALQVAEALGPKLWGVRLDTSEKLVDRALLDEMGEFKPTGVAPQLVRKVRAALDEAGYPARQDRRLRWLQREPDRRVRGRGRARRCLRRRLVADPGPERLHGGRGHGRGPARRQGRPALQAQPPHGAGDLMAFLSYDDVESFALTWLPLILMALLVFLVWRTLKVVPRTKPQQIRPETKLEVAWDDIAGVDEAKEELREVVEFLRDPKRFQPPRRHACPTGILLHGPPGTGKTLLAKAVAHESGANFFAQSAAAFVEMFAGLGAARIRRLFGIARKHAPAIVFIDELDAVGGQRGSDISGEKRPDAQPAAGRDGRLPDRAATWS